MATEQIALVPGVMLANLFVSSVPVAPYPLGAQNTNCLNRCEIFFSQP